MSRSREPMQRAAGPADDRVLSRREALVAGAALMMAGMAGALPAHGEERGEKLMSDQTAGQGGRPKKGVIWSMLPGSLPAADRFKLAKDVGFDGVEMPPVNDLTEAEGYRAAAEKAGIRIHSVIYGGWEAPLTSGDAAVAERGMKAVEQALKSAATMGADDILLVPGIVNAGTRYADAYERSQERIKRLIPTAESQKVLILIEEVWNNFLLSPLEFARYVDGFKSKWVQAYFDVGNIVAFAWPEDWVRTLGPRIKKVHLKDYKGGPGLGGNGHFVPLLEGSINWPEVRKAFGEVGYHGFMTTELEGGDEKYLRDVSSRVDKIIG